MPLQYVVQNCHLAIIKHLISAGKNGAFITNDVYKAITEDPLLKEHILGSLELSTRAILNKYNNSDLPRIYRINEISEKLPAIDRLKVSTCSNLAQDIARHVESEIQSNGYCNVTMCPIMLNSFCVSALSEFYGV